MLLHRKIREITRGPRDVDNHKLCPRQALFFNTGLPGNPRISGESSVSAVSKEVSK